MRKKHIIIGVGIVLYAGIMSAQVPIQNQLCVAGAYVGQHFDGKKMEALMKNNPQWSYMGEARCEDNSSLSLCVYAVTDERTGEPSAYTSGVFMRNEKRSDERLFRVIVALFDAETGLFRDAVCEDMFPDVFNKSAANELDDYDRRRTLFDDESDALDDDEEGTFSQKIEVVRSHYTYSFIRISNDGTRLVTVLCCVPERMKMCRVIIGDHLYFSVDWDDKAIKRLDLETGDCYEYDGAYLCAPLAKCIGADGKEYICFRQSRADVSETGAIPADTTEIDYYLTDTEVVKGIP